MRQALQRVSALDDLGDPDAPVGSESWARWFVGQARDQRKKLDDDVSRMQRLLGKLESGQAWKALGFLSFSVLCHTELELSETEAAAIKSAKRGRSLAAVLAADPGTRPLEKHGGMREQGADGTLLSHPAMLFERSGARVRRENCLLYLSDAAHETLCVYSVGRSITHKNTTI